MLKGGQIITTTIDRFDGGIVNDPRDTSSSTCRMVSNFDILTNPRKLTPYRQSESGDSAGSTSLRQTFCVALRTGTTTYSLYALGQQSGISRAEISYKNFSTGSANDLDDNGWANTTNYQASQGTPSYNLFVFYKKTGLIYGAHTGTHIYAYDPTGTAAFADTHQALSYTNIAQGIVHPKDDILYVPYDNKIAVNNNGSWNTTGLTLPTSVVITSICAYGNFLAIATSPLSGVGNSTIYLWDRDTTLATASENINCGEGIIKILEEVDGVLVAISLSGGTLTDFLISSPTALRFSDKVTFRYISGQYAIKFKEITGTTQTILRIAKQKINTRLYFMMSIVINGTRREGVWSIGRSSPSEPMTLVHERTPNNATALTNGQLYGFIFAGDYLFQAFLDNNVHTVTKTDDTATYTTNNSIYETKIINLGDSSVTKKLLRVIATSEYLPASTDYTIQYMKDSETSWTTIFTESDDNSISHTAINIESTGVTLPEYDEIQFRILSTGAEITSLMLQSEIIDKGI